MLAESPVRFKGISIPEKSSSFGHLTVLDGSFNLATN